MERCLSSISSIDIKNYKVVIVDNNSNNTDFDNLKSKFPQYHFIQLARNYGFAYANNYAIRMYNAEYYLLLNPDTEFIDSNLSKVINRISKEDVGILGCRLLNPDYTFQPSTGSFPSNINLFINFSGLKYFKNNFFFKIIGKLLFLIDKKQFERQNNDYFTERYVDVVWGAFFLVKKEVFDRIGLLDENFFLGGEENEFCYRAKLNNIKTLYFPNYSIIHYFNASVKKNRVLSLNAQLKGYIYYYRKHFGKNSLNKMKIIVRLALYLRYIFIKTNLLTKYLVKREELKNYPDLRKILQEND